MPTENGTTHAYNPDSPYNDIEIHDLIGQSPNWILRSGIMIVFLVVASILAFSMVIRFPDRIQAPIIITTENPPIEIITEVEGKIGSFFVQDEERVDEGQVIAYIENATDASEVKQLRNFFSKYDKIKNDIGLLSLPFPYLTALGNMQEEASAFEQKYSEFKILLQQKGLQDQVVVLEKEAEKIGTLNEVMEKEKSLLQQEMAWNEKEKERFKKLNVEKIVSDSEYGQKEVILIQNRRQFEGLDREIIRNQIRMEELLNQKLQLSESFLQNNSEYRFLLKELRNRLLNGIQEWEEQYFIKAPIQGTCNIPVELAEKTMMQAGATIAYLVPGEKAGHLLAQAKIRALGIGKIESGDRALVRLDAFPFKEFGNVESQVGNISIMPSLEEEEQVYTVIIPLGKEMKTDFNRTLPYRPNMSGNVSILTKDKSLFHRIFEQFINLLKG